MTRTAHWAIALTVASLGLAAATDAGAQQFRPRQGRALSPPISIEPPAEPNVSCPEGRAATGRCVRPALAVSGRDRGIIFTQARLSMLAPPRVLPSGTMSNDRLFRSPNNSITDADAELDLFVAR
jgi:hypothetical protein